MSCAFFSRTDQDSVANDIVESENGSIMACIKSFGMAFVSIYKTKKNMPCVYTTIIFFVNAPLTKNKDAPKNNIGSVIVMKDFR